MEIFINFTLPCINTMVANHFEMFFWYMLHKQFDKFNGWKCSFYIFVIFMTVVMESNGIFLFVIMVYSF